MPDNKTTPATGADAIAYAARKGLLSFPYLPGDAYWVDMLKQEFSTQRQLALQSEVPEVKRRHYALAAQAADFLSRYYQREGMNPEAELWITRATRLHRIASARRNSTAANIGASMP